MKIFDRNDSGRQHRADMYLPLWLLIFSISLNLGALASALYAIATAQWFIFIITAIAAGFGIAAFLCWKNQKIILLDNSRFEYTTFLGKTTVYYFSQIRELKRNSDSFTLLVGDGKVHIESCAIISDELLQKIDEALSKNIFSEKL